MANAAAPPRVGASGRRKANVLSLVLILLGALALSYPVVATYWKNTEQAKIAERYRDEAAELDTETRDRLLAEARAYNEANAGAPVLDPWLARVSKDNDPYQRYLQQLSMGDEEAPFGAITIPSIDVYLPIYHGTEPDVLEAGVGHLYGSALPVGGEGIHSVLTGHSGLIDATLFDDLEDVEMGELFHIDVLGEVMTYKVDQIEVVLPNETELTQPVVGRDLVTLITCTPYGINTHRLLVRGTRVPTPEDASESFRKDTGAWQNWMFLALGVLLLLLLLWWWLSRRRKRREEQEPRDDA